MSSKLVCCGMGLVCVVCLKGAVIYCVPYCTCGMGLVCVVCLKGAVIYCTLCCVPYCICVSLSLLCLICREQ